MKWSLKSSTEKAGVKEKQRTYINEQTGTECTTQIIYTDKMGNEWWAFTDLFKIPYIRVAYSKSIADLFQTGLSAADIKAWVQKEKNILKSNDPEKYEKLYSLLLEKETIIENTVDPMKQHLALCTIYVLAEDERVDYYSVEDATKKMALWDLDHNAKAFFLNWLQLRTTDYMKGLNQLSQIASNQMPLNQMEQLVNI